MAQSSEPKYDNDLINYGYLKKVLESSGGLSTRILELLPKSYNSPPPTPYNKGSLLSYQGKLFQCIEDRKIGNFSWDDWKLIATDDTEVNNFIDNTYSIDKLSIQSQLDNKIESFYQEDDPALSWTDDITKKLHVGDYWYNTINNTQWRYTEHSTNPITYDWQPVDVPMAVYDRIDTKKSIYTSKPTSYKKDDLWIIEEDLLDDDLPDGVNRKDFVFASEDSNEYNKEHWIKRSDSITIEYLEQHYYNVETLDSSFEEISRGTDSKISQMKDEIELSVSQTYETKETIQNILNDYDEQIGEITETIATHGNALSDLSVENGRISASVSNIETKITTIEDENGTIKENIQSVIKDVENLQTDTSQTIKILEQIEENGVDKIVTDTGFTFDKLGLTIDQFESKVKDLLDSKGITIFDKTGEEAHELFFAGYDETINQAIVRSANMWAKQYQIIGNINPQGDFRWETFNHETYGVMLGCFELGSDI